jgi:hypothetical protein
MLCRRIIWALLALIATTVSARAVPADRYGAEPQYWSVTVYAGPSCTKYFGAVLQDFNLQSREVILGVALDRKLARLFEDFYLSGEIQANQIVYGHPNTTFALMLGFEADNLLGFERTSFSFHLGPSYALDPPYTSVGYKHRTYPAWRKKFINAIAMEFASGLPWSENWDWTARLYHRSGVFGLYSDGDDDGLAVGLGLKYHF